MNAVFLCCAYAHLGKGATSYVKHCKTPGCSQTFAEQPLAKSLNVSCGTCRRTFNEKKRASEENVGPNCPFCLHSYLEKGKTQLSGQPHCGEEGARDGVSSSPRGGAAAEGPKPDARPPPREGATHAPVQGGTPGAPAAGAFQSYNEGAAAAAAGAAAPPPAPDRRVRWEAIWKHAPKTPARGGAATSLAEGAEDSVAPAGSHPPP